MSLNHILIKKELEAQFKAVNTISLTSENIETNDLEVLNKFETSEIEITGDANIGGLLSVNGFIDNTIYSVVLRPYSLQVVNPVECLLEYNAGFEVNSILTNFIVNRTMSNCLQVEGYCDFNPAGSVDGNECILVVRVPHPRLLAISIAGTSTINTNQSGQQLTQLFGSAYDPTIITTSLDETIVRIIMNREGTAIPWQNGRCTFNFLIQCTEAPPP